MTEALGYLLQEDNYKIYLEEKTPAPDYAGKYSEQETVYQDKYSELDNVYVPKYLNYLLKEDYGCLLQENGYKIFLEEKTPGADYVEKYL